MKEFKLFAVAGVLLALVVVATAAVIGVDHHAISPHLPSLAHAGGSLDLSGLAFFGIGMTKKYVQPGNILTRPNPGGSAKDVVVSFSTFIAVTLDGTSTTPTGTLQGLGVKGVFELPKLAEGISQGDPLFWNGASLTKIVTGDIVGVAAEIAPTGDTTMLAVINDLIAGRPTGSL